MQILGLRSLPLISRRIETFINSMTSTPKSVVFSSSSSLPSLVGEGGGLVFESVGEADLMSDNCESKQSRKPVDLPFTCHPSASLTTFAFRSSEVRCLLLDLGPDGGIDPFGYVSSFQ